MAVSVQQKKFFKFLQQKENSRKTFSEVDVERVTDWKPATFRTYYGKGQFSEFVNQNDDGSFVATNVVNITVEDFSKKTITKQASKSTWS